MNWSQNASLLKNPKIEFLLELIAIFIVYESLARIYPKARYNQEWINAEYREFICEDFHFAYQIYTLENGSEIVRIHDASHSLLYKE